MKKKDDLILPSFPQPTRSDAVKNRALLLETARRLFAEQGVHAVSMSAIAEAAGVGKGTLYRHFENKAELCQALLDEDQRDLQERALEYLRRSPTACDSLRWFMSEVLRFVDRNRVMLCQGLSAAAFLQHPAHWWWRQTIHGLLEQMNPSADLDFLADTLYAALDVHTIYFLRHVQGYSLERVTEGILGNLDKLTA
jgi:AcrR family transcriptional regulator